MDPPSKATQTPPATEDPPVQEHSRAPEVPLEPEHPLAEEHPSSEAENLSVKDHPPVPEDASELEDSPIQEHPPTPEDKSAPEDASVQEHLRAPDHLFELEYLSELESLSELEHQSEPDTLLAPGNSPASDQAKSLRHHEVDHWQLNLSGERKGPSPLEKRSTIDTLLTTGSPDHLLTHDLEIFFLPKIHVDEGDRPKDDPDFPILLDDREVCSELTTHLHLDPLFLTKEAWDSNGFLLGQQDWHTHKDIAHSYTYATRFLIKFLREEHVQHDGDYKWLFLSFSVLWVKTKQDKASCILVCFDDSNIIKDQIVEACKTYCLGNIKQTPFSVYDALLRAVVMQYDKALWLFREPVRKIEKERLQFASSILALRSQQVGPDNPVTKLYIEMHELSRHTIHMSETLQVAAKTVKATLRYVDSHPLPGQSKAGVMNTIAGLQFSAGFLANLKLRADAFVDRLENEIRLAYNIVSIHQLQSNQELLENTQELLQHTQRILQESQDEGKDFTKRVTGLTFIFLPLTFATGFWGMNFIRTGKDSTSIAGDVWKFFASAVGVLLFCLILEVCLRWQDKIKKTFVSIFI
ncbi:hypothetical protein BKA56DRAFT_672449 [Ilyonectria sp. MPI-CAGE-AT-0026]|nr:hypothetical protein BKA56DRAFT_672449 [Ilyonectria sp. MPI-CAGE-AT-0026]